MTIWVSLSSIKLTEFYQLTKTPGLNGAFLFADYTPITSTTKSVCLSGFLLGRNITIIDMF